MAQTTTRNIAITQAQRRKRWLNRDRLTAIALLSPSIVAIAIFVYGFIAWSGYVSLSNWNTLTTDYSFAGLKNYQTIFNSGRFQTNIRNLIVFTTFFLCSCLVLGMLL